MPLNHSSKYSELTNEQFLLIGKVIIEFSNIDFLLGVLLSRLLITPEFLGRTYTDRMTVTMLMEKIKNAINIQNIRYRNKIISGKIADEILSLLNRIDKLRIFRNRFSHYCWARFDNEKIFGTELSGKLPKSKNPNNGSVIITNKELEEIYKKAYVIVDELNKLVYSLPEMEENKDLINKLTFQ